MADENYLKGLIANAEKEDQYAKRLASYHRMTLQIRQLELQNTRMPNVKSAEQIQKIDAARHALHLEMEELGKKLGKGRSTVALDILGKEQNLAEVGLPELSMKTADGLRFDGPSWRTELEPDEVLIVFGGTSRDDDKYFYTPLDDLKFHRAEALAQALPEKVRAKRIEDDVQYHTISLSIYGVIIKADDFNDIVSLIRENPNQFRTATEFFTPEDIRRGEESYTQSLEQQFDEWLQEASLESIEQDAGPSYLLSLASNTDEATAHLAERAFESWLTMKRRK